MGGDISVDKHMTPIEEWFDVRELLEGISFQEEAGPHVAAWKLFGDQLNPQEFNCLPVEIDLNLVHQIVSPHQTYIVCAIRNDHETVEKAQIAALSNLLHSIRQNIEPSSAETPVVMGTVDGYSYSVYAYLGKLSKMKIRLAALSYALKMEDLLNSKKKMAILSGGGVLRNKKLQKGSTLSILASAPAISKQIIDCYGVHVFSFFWKERSRGNPLLAYKTKRACPFIACKEIAPKPTGGMKPPMLRLDLNPKPFEQPTYSEIEDEQNGQIKFDIRTTARHELKMQKFRGECNQILDGIFVSGEKVAKNWQMFQNHKIQAVVNCAGDYCDSWFQNRGIPYLTLFLKDSQNQNIECLFYRVIEFIQSCQKNKSNVLVHCIQGISRSVTMVIAYIIFKLGYDYKKAEQFVKQRRGISCPNNGFMVELIQFHKRLYEDYGSLPSPRVFLVSSHSKETPSLITARMIKHSLFDPRKDVSLDCRGIYIVQTPDMVYIWVGSRCEEKKLKSYWSYAQEYVKKLQKYERASIKLKAISQGTEGKEFLALWNQQEIPKNYENPEYTRLFSEGETTKPGGMRKFYERQIDEEDESHKKLFIYPDFEQGLGVFQFDQLGDLSILANNEDGALTLFECRDDDVQHNESVVGQFVENIIRVHYSSIDPSKIVIVQETVEDASQQFMKQFA